MEDKGLRMKHGGTEEMKELEEDLRESVRKYLAASLTTLIFPTLLRSFHSSGMKDADSATVRLFYKTTHLLFLLCGSPSTSPDFRAAPWQLIVTN